MNGMKETAKEKGIEETETVEMIVTEIVVVTKKWKKMRQTGELRKVQKLSLVIF